MKRRAYPTAAQNIQVIGLAGSSRVRFSGRIPHGKARYGREVVMDVDPLLILRIADAIHATSGHACCDPAFDHCDLKHREGVYEAGRMTKDELERFALTHRIGHAIWHVDNPDMPMPCRRSRGSVIDIDEAAPALLATTEVGS